MELTDEDFEDIHEELLVKDSPVEVGQKDSVIVYLKIKVRKRIQSLSTSISEYVWSIFTGNIQKKMMTSCLIDYLVVVFAR